MMFVVKRDGRIDTFDKNKVSNAVKKAFIEVDGDLDEKSEAIIGKIADEVSAVKKNRMSVEDIQNMVVNKLMATSRKDVATRYVEYRYKRKMIREANTTDETIMELLGGKSDYWNNENSNKNADLVTTQRDYMAGIVSEDISKRFLLPKDIVDAHNAGIIHFHDIDYFAQNALNNCCLINLDDMLQNGTVISGVMIEKPHSFATACNIATQIIAQVASSQYGGQTISLTHLAPFVDVSRQKIKKDALSAFVKFVGHEPETDDEIAHYNNVVESMVKDEVRRGVQTIQYQVVTLMTTNGQAPFLSVFMYLNETDDDQTKADLALIIEEVLNQRIQGVKNEKGVWVTPAFPKLLYVLEDDNTYEGSKYYYLTKLAAKCTAKRMVPDYISEKKMKEYKLSKGEEEGNGDCYGCMGCRSFLTPDRSGNGFNNIAKAKNYDGKPKYYGRFNQGVVTINLPDIALSSGGDIDKFWELFEERTELCHRALRLRTNRLEGTPSDVAPILWQYGAFARLKRGETIDKLLYGGYSTISLGYAGLYECVKYMTGHSHTDGDIGEKFGLEVMQALNDKCTQWKEEEDIDYSLYGSPIESTTYKFAKCLKKRFGEIEGVTDKNYVTNSYHVHVTEQIDAFDKLAIEAKFQKLSPGGAISYVEVPNLTDNIDAVIQIIQFIYENIMYAELNTKSDYCMVCGWDKEIKIVEDEETGKLVWECPNCGNRDQNKMSVARRTCGLNK